MTSSKDVKAQTLSKGELEAFEILKSLYRHELNPAQALEALKQLVEPEQN